MRTPTRPYPVMSAEEKPDLDGIKEGLPLERYMNSIGDARVLYVNLKGSDRIRVMLDPAPVNPREVNSPLGVLALLPESPDEDDTPTGVYQEVEDEGLDPSGEAREVYVVKQMNAYEDLDEQNHAFAVWSTLGVLDTYRFWLTSTVEERERPYGVELAGIYKVPSTEGMDKEQAANYLKSELEEFNAYLAGLTFLVLHESAVLGGWEVGELGVRSAYTWEEAMSFVGEFMDSPTNGGWVRYNRFFRDGGENWARLDAANTSAHY